MQILDSGKRAMKTEMECKFRRGKGHRESTCVAQAILSIRSNVEGQGTAVGEPLGARQVAVMILGDVSIC